MESIALSSPRGVRFARVAFLGASFWGAFTLLPLPFMRAAIEEGRPLTHPEYFYGFIGVCIAFQLIFVLISRDPLRYRPMMPCCMVEKVGFALPALWLVHAGAAPRSLLVFAFADLLLLVLFLWSFLETSP